MSKFNKYKLLDYINNPMSRESILVLYSSNNITIQRCELYSDFVQSLLMLAFDTYMGDDVTNVEHQTKHFEWCWKKNITNFKLEGFDFEDHKLYSYFLEFMLEAFYSSLDKNDENNNDKTLLKIWYDIFDFNRPKSNSDMDTLIEIYNIFQKSIKTI